MGTRYLSIFNMYILICSAIRLDFGFGFANLVLCLRTEPLPQHPAASGLALLLAPEYMSLKTCGFSLSLRQALFTYTRPHSRQASTGSP